MQVAIPNLVKSFSTWTSVLQCKVLVLELVSIDGLSSSSIVVGEISTLGKEYKIRTWALSKNVS